MTSAVFLFVLLLSCQRHVCSGAGHPGKQPGVGSVRWSSNTTLLAMMLNSSDNDEVGNQVHERVIMHMLSETLCPCVRVCTCVLGGFHWCDKCAS